MRKFILPQKLFSLSPQIANPHHQKFTSPDNYHFLVPSPGHVTTSLNHDKVHLDMSVMQSAHKQATNTQSAIRVNTPSSTSHENCLPAHTSPDHVSTTVDVTVQGTEDNNSGEDIPLKRQNLKTLTETKECIDTAVMPAPKISIGENCYAPMVKSLVTSICDKSTSPMLSPAPQIANHNHHKSHFPQKLSIFPHITR